MSWSTTKVRMRAATGLSVAAITLAPAISSAFGQLRGFGDTAHASTMHARSLANAGHLSAGNGSGHKSFVRNKFPGVTVRPHVLPGVTVKPPRPHVLPGVTVKPLRPHVLPGVIVKPPRPHVLPGVTVKPPRPHVLPGVIVKPPRPHGVGGGYVVPGLRYVVGPPVAAVARSCFRKDYLQDGSIVLIDECTQQQVVVPRGGNDCLRTQDATDGSMWFADVCTTQQVRTPPAPAAETIQLASSK